MDWKRVALCQREKPVRATGEDTNKWSVPNNDTSGLSCFYECNSLWIQWGWPTFSSLPSFLAAFLLLAFSSIFS